jgi:hypothetical protein
MILPLLPEVDPDHSDSIEAVKQKGDAENQGWKSPSNKNSLPKNIDP